jgi:Protein of unknown function (DUF4446)
VSNLNSTTGIVAIAAGVVAVIALLCCLALMIQLRRLRGAQKAVLGDGSQDLVTHAAQLQASFESLAQYVEDVGVRLEGRVSSAEARLNGTIAHRALIRYDAYGEMSGEQSASLALLDANHDGIVLTTISHRDTSRMYLKQIFGGKSRIGLSPEEQDAINRAISPAPIEFQGEPGGAKGSARAK